MPDRAVVDDEALGCVPPHASYPVTFEVERVFQSKPSAMGLPDPEPRALVAISEDRQCLVVLEESKYDAVHKERWQVYCYCRDLPNFVNPWHWTSSLGDTGQSADEVLREFLEGRS